MKPAATSFAEAKKHLPETDRETFHLRHQTVGRVRYFVPALYRAPQNCQFVSQRLTGSQQLSRVRTNPTTGSITLEHHAATPVADLETALDQALRQLSRRSSPHQSEHPSSVSEIPPPDTTTSGHIWWIMSEDQLHTSLATHAKNGLSMEEVERRLLQYGTNTIADHEPPTKAELLRRQFANPQVAMLAGSAVLSLATGGLIDVIMIGGVVIFNSAVGYLSENHAERIVSSIGHLPPQPCRVIRDGLEQYVPESELVPGDKIILETGMVPADIRLTYAKRLMVDESSLTGESMPVSKKARSLDTHKVAIGERKNMVYRGTIITAGQGVGIVVGTGQQTEIGWVQQLVTSTATQTSPMQRNLATLGRQTVWASSLVCGGVFVMGLARGFRFTDILQTSISLAVAAVPEGLPTIGTTTLAAGVQRLERRGILTRRLPVIETLGAVDVLCLDKTGTLTLNRMAAKAVAFVDVDWVLPLPQEPTTARLNDLHQLIQAVVLCNDCYQENEQWHGSSTELAFIYLARDQGLQPAQMQTDWPRLKTRYRSENRQYMVTYHQSPDTPDQILCAVKGNPTQLVERCQWYLDEGERKPLTPEIRDRILQQNDELASRALRVLGVASGWTDQPDQLKLKKIELVWLGHVGLQDPTREGMADFIRSMHDANIKTIMMTGDQTATARAVGHELALNHNSGLRVIDAKEFIDLAEEEVDRLIHGVDVFSRVSPSEKLKIVQALQKRGHIVAMTGDGINDSPALKAADVGIAMGRYGSNAARESADLILETDDLRMLWDALEQGRSIRSNLKRALRFLLATNLSEILLMFFSIGLGRGSPLNPIQLLWINLLTDVFPALALALEKPRPSIMTANPIPADRDLFDRDEKRSLLTQGLILTGAALLNYEYSRSRYQDPAHADSQAFFTLTVSQTLYTLTAMRDSRLHLNDVFNLERNQRWIQWSILASLLLIILGVRSRQVTTLLRNETLDSQDLVIGSLSSILSFWLDEMQKKTETGLADSIQPQQIGGPASQ